MVQKLSNTDVGVLENIGRGAPTVTCWKHCGRKREAPTLNSLKHRGARSAHRDKFEILWARCAHIENYDTFVCLPSWNKRIEVYERMFRQHFLVFSCNYKILVISRSFYTKI